MYQMTLNDLKFFNKISEIIKMSKPLHKEGNYIEFEPVLIEISNARVIEDIAHLYYGTEDFLYYKKVEAELDHLLYKWNFQWITSRRQLIQLSEDCFSVIQLIERSDPKKLILNCYQRSCNIDTSLKTDIAFLCYWMIKHSKNYEFFKINIFNMIPHTWGNKRSKVEQR